MIRVRIFLPFYGTKIQKYSKTTKYLSKELY